MKYRRAFLIIGFLITATVKANAVNLASPNGKLRWALHENDSNWTYELTLDNKKLITQSLLGYVDEAGRMFPDKLWRVSNVALTKHKSVWHPVWGKRTEVNDRYNEAVITALSSDGKSTFYIVARAYNDGVAFKYRFGDGLMAKSKENTEFHFGGDYTAWYYNGERPNIGPEKLTESEGERLPVMTVDAGCGFMAIHEANLTDGAPMRLESEKGSVSFRVKNNFHDTKPGYESAWRVIFCAHQIGTLVDSHLLELLNPDPTMDFSWVKPGVALWDWRINGAEWEGFRYEMSYPSWVKMVDFAAEQGFSHLVLDANWYGPEFEKDSDPTKGDKAASVRKLIEYGKSKKVGIWLYLNDVAGRNYPIEETLKQYGSWGAAGVKYGFMTGSPEEKNRKTRGITRICAENKLLVDFHDYPVHPYGQMRTWPNAVTREFCKAQLDGHDVFYPKTFVTSVFVNMIAGPIDMNNGLFDLRQGRTTRVDNNQEVPSTVASEAARTLITFSGATVIPDIPEYYQKYPALLRFLSSQKQPWRESKTLDGKIGEYIVMMRQSADGYYLIGVAGDENRRVLEIPLDFLPKGRYMAEITEDGANAHYLNNRETITCREEAVSSKSTLRVSLAQGGGACIIIKRK